MMDLADTIATWLTHQQHKDCAACIAKLKYEVEELQYASPGFPRRLRRAGKMFNAEHSPIAHIYDKISMLCYGLL